MKKQVLISELNGQTEPNVKMWIDESSIFWLSESQGPVWISDHRGISDYIDENHTTEYRKMGEGVGNNGVEWMNGDFENPFHISDFLARIEPINSFHF